MFARSLQNTVNLKLPLTRTLLDVVIIKLLSVASSALGVGGYVLPNYGVFGDIYSI